jgi:hypothetical protein
LLVVGAVLGSPLLASAQEAPGPPGDAIVTVDGFNVGVRWTRPTTGGPPSGFQLLVRKDGANFPGSPFNIPVTTTSVSGGPLPPGSYTVQALAWNGFGFRLSAIVAFVIGVTGAVPGLPIFPRATVVDNAVTLEWNPPTDGGTSTDYELQAMSPGGSLVSFRSGGLTRLQFFGILAGLYMVRVRALNAFGSGPFTNFILVAVGVGNLYSGNISAGLLWNGPGDVDLHVQEPGGTDVFPGNPVGPSASVGRGDSDGFGPEIIRVLAALAGAYRFFATCSAVAANTPISAQFLVRVAGGTPLEAAYVFTSTICGGSQSTSYDLAQVAIPSGAVTQTGQ